MTGVQTCALPIYPTHAPLDLLDDAPTHFSRTAHHFTPPADDYNNKMTTFELTQEGQILKAPRRCKACLCVRLGNTHFQPCDATAPSQCANYHSSTSFIPHPLKHLLLSFQQTTQDPSANTTDTHPSTTIRTTPCTACARTTPLWEGLWLDGGEIHPHSYVSFYLLLL